MPDDALVEHHRQDGSKNQRKNQRTVLLDDLRGGPNGVARWNDRSQNQRTATGPFRGLDFGGVDLESAELSDCDFRGSSFKGANLRYARLYFTDLKKVCFQGACLAGATCIQMKASEADFSDADLTGTRLCRSNLSNSKFANAQLERTNFEDCNVCGADLSTGLQLESAQLSGAQFDHKTRFPVNFVLPQALRWSGAGVDPRPDAQGNRRIVQSNVTHFNDFLHNLRLIVQEDRLLKAMKMLKSDRFKLFSEYTESELIGVVKSQSDPDLVYACTNVNIDFNQNVAVQSVLSGGNANLRAVNGGLSNDGLISANVVNLQSGKATTINAMVRANNGNVNLLAGSSLLANQSIMSTNGTLNIQVTDGPLTTAPTALLTATGGNVNVSQAGTTGQITLGGNVFTFTSGNISISNSGAEGVTTASLMAGGSGTIGIAATATGASYTAQPFSLISTNGGDINIAANQNISVQTVISGAAVGIQATNGTFSNAGLLSSTTKLSLSSGLGTTFNGAVRSNNGQISIQAGSLTANQGITATNGSLNILVSTGSLTTAPAALLTAIGGNIDIVSLSAASGSMMLNGGANVVGTGNFI